MTISVGDPVFFHPASNISRSHFAPSLVCAAIVAKVLPASLNLAVFDGHGANHPMEDVPLIDGDAVPPTDGYYATIENAVPTGKLDPEPTPMPVLPAPTPVVVVPIEPSPAEPAANV